MSTPARERIQKILGGSPKYVQKAGRSFPKAGWYLQKEGGWKYLGRNAEEVICTSAKYRQKKQLTHAQALAAAQTLSLEELQQILREEHGEEYGEVLKDLKAQEPPQAEQEQLLRMKAILGAASPPPATALPPSAPAPSCRCKPAAPALPAPAGGLVPVRPAIIEVEPIEMPGAGLVARARQILAGAPLLPASPVRGLLPAPQPAPSADPPGDESSPGSMEAPPPVEAAAVEPAQRVGTATYDPADNKLRLTPFKRLDREVYERVKAAGFVWAPKQEVFVAPAWTPEREDLLLELAGDIEDEDSTLVDRAAVRAERFEEYSEKREQDAERARQAVSAIADNIPLGQPILVGHHSERRARRDAERIRRGMRKAVDLWHTSQYWEHRAKAALRHAKYKERPDVRHRRIKGLEADLRKQERELADAQRFLKLWSVQPLTQERALAIADVHGSGPWGLWSELRDGKITAAGAAAKATEVLAARLDRAERWIEHVQNRLAYERTMLQEAVGESYEEKWKDVEPGGRVLIGNEWSVILRVNRKGGKIVSVTTNRRYVPVVGIELIQNYEPPAPEVAAKVKAATALPPLVNYPGQGFRHMTRDEWERSQRASDFYHVKRVAASENAGAHRLRTGPKGGGAPSWDTTGVYLTDQPRKNPPPPGTGTERTEARRALDEKREPVIRPRPAPPKKEPTVFDQMAQSLKSGVQVVQAEQLFPTPPELARRLVDEAGIRPEHHVLEPSAGTGNLVQAILETGLPPEHLHCIEINHALADALRHRWPQVAVVTVDFMTWQAPRQYERIVMNPPFAQGQDIQHIKRAYNMLAPGGLLVALCANGARQNEQLMPMVEAAGGTWERLPPGSFTQQGTNVSVVLLTLPAREKENWQPTPPPGDESSPSPPLLEAKLAEVREKRHKAERAMHRHKEKMGSKPSVADHDKEELLVRDWRQLRHQEDELARRLDAARGVSPALGERIAEAAQDLAAQAKAALPAVQDAARAAVAKVVEVVREVASTVSQAEPDQAAKVAPSQAEPEPPCPPSIPGCRLQVEGGSCGLATEVLLKEASTGPLDAQPARYCVMDIRDLIPSHATPWAIERARAGDPHTPQALAQSGPWRPRPDYPEETQERRYEQARETSGVYDIVARFRPGTLWSTTEEVTSGPSLVTAQGWVLGGNKRAMGLDGWYHAEPDKTAQRAAEAKGYLKERAAWFGLGPEQLDAIERPALVRVVPTRSAGKALSNLTKEDRRELVDLVRAFNRDLQTKIDTITMATAQARRLPPEAIEELGRRLGDSPLAEFLSTSESERFIEVLARAGILEEAQHLSHRGKVNDAGKSLLAGLLLASMLRDAALIEKLPDSLRTTLTQMAPYLIAAAEQHAEDPAFDLRPALQAALFDYLQMRNEGSPTIEQYERQARLFGKIHFNDMPHGRELLQLLLDRGSQPRKMTSFARTFARAAQPPDKVQIGLFPAKALTADEAFAKALSGAYQ